MHSAVSRCASSTTKIEFTPMDGEEVLDYMRRYHPMYEQLDSKLLLRIDDEYAHGMLGNWTNMTKRLHVEMQRRRTGKVTEELIEAAFVRLDATQ